MSFKQNDVIEFEDGKKVLVIDAIEYGNEEYVFISEMLADESDITKVFKVMLVDYATGCLNKIVDKDLLEILLPQFEKRLKKQYNEV